jgi:heterodisulfide reductase subunit D
VALMRAASCGELDPAPATSNRIYSCTLCAACTEACPSGVRVDELLRHGREELAARDLLPEGLARLTHTLHETHNVSGEDNGLRLIWAQNLPRPPGGAAKAQAEVIYFVGCVSSFYPRSYAIPQATVQILDAAGVDYGLLGGEEWCCGYPLLANGSPALAREAMLHNLERVAATGARQVVLSCPSCYHIWKHEYPRLAGLALEDAHPDGLQITHIAELLADLVDQGRLPLRRLERVVTYHDPCDLGRKSEVVDAPRQVLRAIPGLTLVEADSLCCGGGGNLESHDPDLAAAAAERRLEQALRTGATTIVSACQQCERTLANAARRQRVRVPVLDLAQIVWRALE